MNREEAAKLVLENKKYKLEYIPEAYNPVFTRIDPDHIGKSIYEGCKMSWELPLSKKNMGYERILTPQQQEAFEILLEVDPGTLSFYRFGEKGNFWNSRKAKVEVGRDGVEFNMEEPLQNLKVRILKVQTNVAPSYEDRRNNPNEYKWMLKDINSVKRTNADIAKLKRKASVMLDNCDINKQINILNILGIRPPANASEEWLINRFDEIIQNSTDKVDQPSVKTLIEAIKDEDTDIKSVMKTCIDFKIFTYKPAGKYYYDGECVVPGGGKNALLEWIKDPENNVTIQAIKQRIKTLTDE